MRSVALALLAALPPGFAVADVTVADPWARASILADRPGAVYLNLTSDSDDRLVSARTPAASVVMLHGVETATNGASRMVHIETLDIAPDEPVTFVPGGMHLMLRGLSRKLEEGDAFPLTLIFETAGEVSVDVQVLGVAASGPGNVE